MSKKRTYTSRISDLMQEAKTETLLLMKEKGVEMVDLPAGSVMVTAENEKGILARYSVKQVTIVNYGQADTLEFNCDMPGVWYINSTLWGEIYDAVRAILCNKTRG